MAAILLKQRKAEWHDNPTIGELIRRYAGVRQTTRPLGESHAAIFDVMQRLDIANVVASELQPSDVITFGQQLKAGVGRLQGPPSRSPATVRQYLSYLRGPLEFAPLGFGLKGISIKAIEDAAPMLEQLDLAFKSRPRDRRPSEIEFDLLMAYFRTQDEHAWCHTPMTIVMEFAVYSCRRLGEITRLKWADFEEDKRMLTVRDMKDPRQKKGNDHRFPLLGRAFDLVMAQPRDVDPCIFPYSSKTCSQRFTQARHVLGIEGLRFHDLRREGICRLLEAGYSPAQVAAVSGHKNWSTLARVYGASIDPEQIHLGPAGAQPK
jgi:integrase